MITGHRGTASSIFLCVSEPLWLVITRVSDNASKSKSKWTEVLHVSVGELFDRVRVALPAKMLERIRRSHGAKLRRLFERPAECHPLHQPSAERVADTGWIDDAVRGNRGNVGTRRRFLSAAAGGLLWSYLPLRAAPAQFPFHVRKRAPYESLFQFIQPGSDEYAIEKEAAEISALLNRLPDTGVLPLAPDFRGRGLGAALFQAAVRLAHEHLGIVEVAAGTEQTNIASQRSLMAAGFVSGDGPDPHILPKGRVIASRWFRSAPAARSPCRSPRWSRQWWRPGS